MRRICAKKTMLCIQTIKFKKIINMKIRHLKVI